MFADVSPVREFNRSLGCSVGCSDSQLARSTKVVLDLCFVRSGLPMCGCATGARSGPHVRRRDGAARPTGTTAGRPNDTHGGAGSGDPLVVFEGGIAVCASIWMTVQRLAGDEKAIEMTELFDLVVIGSGPAGEKGAGPGRLLRQEGSDR